MILLVGSTGALGQRVAELLRQRGEPLRALVRPSTDASGLEALGAEIARGDLLDRASVRAACEGAQTVISTATAMSTLLEGAGGPSIREVDEVGAAGLVDAAEAAGVERFVYVSYAGVEAGIGFPLERAKAATEARLRRSRMLTAVIRPDAFQEIHLTAVGQFDLGRKRVGVLGRGESPCRFVSREDVAALVTAVALEPQPPALTEFGGPEALSRQEAIRVAERVTGEAFKRRRLPRPVVRLAMRLLARPKPAVASVLGTGLVMDLHPAHWDDAPLRERGIEPRSASDFIRQQAAG
jgi:uncharacterized protein YbjT (DUF2867 family)